jgi:sulfate adenylyltransferase subunit 2
MNPSTDLENHSIYILREARRQFRNPAMLWSVGKDSTTLVWLCRKAFFGKVPFPVLHIDTGFKFRRIYEFRDEWTARWGLNLIVVRNDEALRRGVNPRDGKLECCNELKTNALKLAIEKFGFDGLLLGIRRDEHGIRAKERYFSPRDTAFRWNYSDQPLELWDLYRADVSEDRHVRVHPLLHWTEKDIWRYVRHEGIPFVDLYLASKGLRYRSIGCETCCSPIASAATTVDEIVAELEASTDGERDGRAQDKENAYNMQRLRALGYM